MRSPLLTLSYSKLKQFERQGSSRAIRPYYCLVVTTLSSFVNLLIPPFDLIESLHWLGAAVAPVLEGTGLQNSAIENPAIEENLRQFLLVLSVSLGVATLSRVLSVLRNIPYTLLLLLVGLGLAVVDVRLVNLSPELILFIFLPPLLFEAAWNIQWSRLKSDLRTNSSLRRFRRHHLRWRLSVRPTAGCWCVASDCSAGRSQPICDRPGFSHRAFP